MIQRQKLQVFSYLNIKVNHWIVLIKKFLIMINLLLATIKTMIEKLKKSKFYGKLLIVFPKLVTRFLNKIFQFCCTFEIFL